jgi:acyl-CoA synthetase (NDP forming)
MKRVAIIGASRDRAKFGNKALRAYIRQGFEVFPIHPQEPEVEGLPAFRSVLEVPGPIDRAALYVPAEVGVTLLSELAQKGVGELFLNPGTESTELVAGAQRLGLPLRRGCAIRDIGEDPGSL